MPPPKKPKTGPTRADQFLTEDELTRMVDAEIESARSIQSYDPDGGSNHDVRGGYSDARIHESYRDAMGAGTIAIPHENMATTAHENVINAHGNRIKNEFPGINRENYDRPTEFLSANAVYMQNKPSDSMSRESEAASTLDSLRYSHTSAAVTKFYNNSNSCDNLVVKPFSPLSYSSHSVRPPHNSVLDTRTHDDHSNTYDNMHHQNTVKNATNKSANKSTMLYTNSLNPNSLNPNALNPSVLHDQITDSRQTKGLLGMLMSLPLQTNGYDNSHLFHAVVEHLNHASHSKNIPQTTTLNGYNADIKHPVDLSSSRNLLPLSPTSRISLPPSRHSLPSFSKRTNILPVILVSPLSFPPAAAAIPPLTLPSYVNPVNMNLFPHHSLISHPVHSKSSTKRLNKSPSDQASNVKAAKVVAMPLISKTSPDSLKDVSVISGTTSESQLLDYAPFNARVDDDVASPAPASSRPSPPPLMQNGHPLSALPSPIPSSHSSSSSMNMYADHPFEGPSPSMLDISSPASTSSPATTDCGMIYEFKVELQDSMPGSSSTNKQCQVCNDSASGFHYGVWSCEGCKAFFKRSIQGHVDYICPATNSCTIDKQRRKSCQACRLRKCYEIGMNKSVTQRKERRPSGCTNGNTNLKKRKLDCGSLQSHVNSPRCTSTSSTPTKSPLKPNVLVQALSQMEMPVLDSQRDPSLPPTLDNLLSSLIVLINRELVYLINWVKHIPGYAKLEVSVQAHLIECSWMELLLLGCAFRSADHNGRALSFAPDLHLNSFDWSTLGLSESFEQIAEISVQLSAMTAHREEVLVLKAIIVTNAEIRKLSDPAQLSGMRRGLIDALCETAAYHHPHDPRHVPSLLLILTHLRQASLQTVEHLRRLRHERHANYSDLLCEVLEPGGLPDRPTHIVPHELLIKPDIGPPPFWHPPDTM